MMGAASPLARSLEPQSPDDGSASCPAGTPRLSMAHSSGPPDIEALCVSLQEDQVERKFAIQMEAGIIQRISARVVRGLGLDHEATEAQRKSAWGRAERIVKRGLGGDDQAEEDAAIAAALADNLAMAAASLAPVAAFRKQVEARMEGKAERLPGFDLTLRMPGFKARGLAVIIGEAGNLSNYATVRKLWRRLGLGMAPGHEEHAYSTWRMKGGLNADDWTAAGYSPKRLGQVYGVVTVPLVMNKGKNRYGELYVARRARTLVTHPEWYLDKNGKMKLGPDGKPSSGHASADAARIITKALLSDLWSEWRGSRASVNAGSELAPAEPIAA